MLSKLIKSIINDWDPLELLPFAPDDEYKLEIQRIVSYIESVDEITQTELAEKIYNIFLDALGSNVFFNSLDECLTIAEKIINELY